MLSQLPDDVLVEIVSYLPTKTLIQTLSLSKQLWNIRSRIPRIKIMKDYVLKKKWLFGMHQAIQCWDFEMIFLFGNHTTEGIRVSLLEAIHQRPMRDIVSITQYIEHSKKNPHVIFEAALHESALYGKIELMKFFMDKGAQGLFALQSAAIGGNTHAINLLLQVPREFTQADWDRGLNGAAFGGHRHLVQFFITQGAKDWNDALIASAKGGHVSLVEYFASLGASNWQKAALAALRADQANTFEYCLKQEIRDFGDLERMCKLYDHQKCLEILQKVLSSKSSAIKTN